MLSISFVFCRLYGLYFLLLLKQFIISHYLESAFSVVKGIRQGGQDFQTVARSKFVYLNASSVLSFEFGLVVFFLGRLQYVNLNQELFFCALNVSGNSMVYPNVAGIRRVSFFLFVSLFFKSFKEAQPLNLFNPFVLFRSRYFSLKKDYEGRRTFFRPLLSFLFLNMLSFNFKSFLSPSVFWTPYFFPISALAILPDTAFYSTRARNRLSVRISRVLSKKRFRSTSFERLVSKFRFISALPLSSGNIYTNTSRYFYVYGYNLRRSALSNTKLRRIKRKRIVRSELFVDFFDEFFVNSARFEQPVVNMFSFPSRLSDVALDFIFYFAYVAFGLAPLGHGSFSDVYSKEIQSFYRKVVSWHIGSVLDTRRLNDLSRFRKLWPYLKKLSGKDVKRFVPRVRARGRARYKGMFFVDVSDYVSDIGESSSFEEQLRDYGEDVVYHNLFAPSVGSMVLSGEEDMAGFFGIPEEFEDLKERDLALLDSRYLSSSGLEFNRVEGDEFGSRSQLAREGFLFDSGAKRVGLLSSLKYDFASAKTINLSVFVHSFFYLNVLLSSWYRERCVVPFNSHSVRVGRGHSLSHEFLDNYILSVFRLPLGPKAFEALFSPEVLNVGQYSNDPVSELSDSQIKKKNKDLVYLSRYWVLSASSLLFFLLSGRNQRLLDLEKVGSYSFFSFPSFCGGSRLMLLNHIRVFYEDRLSVVRYKAVAFSKRYYLSFLDRENIVYGGPHSLDAILDGRVGFSKLPFHMERISRGEHIFPSYLVFPPTAVSVFLATMFLELNFFSLRFIKKYAAPCGFSAKLKVQPLEDVSVFFSSVLLGSLLNLFGRIRVLIRSIFSFLKFLLFTPILFVRVIFKFCCMFLMIVVNGIIWLFLELVSGFYFLFSKFKSYFR